jgi:hypothetical protein
MRTHEDYVKDVAQFVVEHADLNPSEYAALTAIKLVYGSGPNGTRGVTFFQRWKTGDSESAVPFVEVSAFGQESPTQLAGTTVHELAHVLAGWEAGHGKGWHDACERLGLRNMKAGGTDYCKDTFADWLWEYVSTLEPPTEGQPVQSLFTGAKPGTGVVTGLGALPFGFRIKRIKGCQAGVGTRGGTSRGAGSGSRLRLFECACHGKGKQLAKPVKVRIAADDFDAVHKPCGKAFKRIDPD